MTKKRFAIYSRKSRFTGKGESIENQIELCRQYIKMHEAEVSEADIVVYEDEGFSGGNMDRPRFQRMMKDIRGNEISSVVCYRLDRISRNIGDFAKMVEELAQHGTEFVSVKENFDTSSPLGRAMMYISSVFSQLERETIAERIRDNMYELSKTGRWLGGVTPTGYRSESYATATVDGKVKQACRLCLVPEEADLVRTIFAKFLAFDSLTQVETDLIRHDYRTKQGKRFTRFAIKNILRNPVYLIADRDAYEYLRVNEVALFSDEEDFDGEHGIAAYNRTLQARGQANQAKPLKEWIVSVGQHRGLISGRDWVRVQDRLDRNRAKAYRKPRSHVALLSGLLACHCGAAMRPKISKRLDPDGERNFAYLCTMKERSRSHVCAMRNPDGHLLDKAVCDAVKTLRFDHALFVGLLEVGQKAIASDRDVRDAEGDHLRNAITEHDEEIRSLIAVLSKAGGPSESYIVKQIDALHDQNETCKARLAELEGLAAEETLSDAAFDDIRQALTHFTGAFDRLCVEEKRAALRSVIQKVVWDGESVHVYFHGSVGAASPCEPFCEDSK